jgi:hypothetical protein
MARNCTRPPVWHVAIPVRSECADATPLDMTPSRTFGARGLKRWPRGGLTNAQGIGLSENSRTVANVLHR